MRWLQRNRKELNAENAEKELDIKFKTKNYRLNLAVSPEGVPRTASSAVKIWTERTEMNPVRHSQDEQAGISNGEKSLRG